MAAGEVFTRLMGEETRSELERLFSVDTPRVVVLDLYRLAAEGKLGAADVRWLIGNGGLPGAGRPAHRVGDFAKGHGLTWSKSTNKKLRAALQQLPPAPPSTPAPVPAKRGTQADHSGEEVFYLVETADGIIVVRDRDAAEQAAAALGDAPWYTVALPSATSHTTPSPASGSSASSGGAGAAGGGGAGPAAHDPGDTSAAPHGSGSADTVARPRAVDCSARRAGARSAEPAGVASFR